MTSAPSSCGDGSGDRDLRTPRTWAAFGSRSARACAAVDFPAPIIPVIRTTEGLRSGWWLTVVPLDGVARRAAIRCRRAPVVPEQQVLGVMFLGGGLCGLAPIAARVVVFGARRRTLKGGSRTRLVIRACDSLARFVRVRKPEGTPVVAVFGQRLEPTQLDPRLPLG